MKPSKAITKLSGGFPISPITNVCEYYYGDHGATEERVRHVPDTWTLLFAGEDSGGELQRRTVTVTEGIFDAAQKGYHIFIEAEQVFIEPR